MHKVRRQKSGVRKVQKAPVPAAPPPDKPDTSSSKDSKTSGTQTDTKKTSHWFRNLLGLFVVVLIVVVVVLVTRLKGPSTVVFPDRSSQETTKAASTGPGTGILVIFALFLIGGLGYAAFQFRSKIAKLATSAYSSVKGEVQQAGQENKDRNDIDEII